MTRYYGILAIAAALAIAGCESNGTNNMASNDQNPNNNSRWDNNGNNSTDARANTDPNRRQYADQNNNNANGTSSDVYGVHNSRGSDKIGTAIATDDRVFLVDAAAAGAYEVSASQLALIKTNDANVKMIAQHMVDDHTKANDQLKALARQKNVMVGTAPSIAQTQMIDKLNNLNGADFDREYLSQQKTAHEDAIARFQTAANTSQDREIRAFAAQTLPTLQDHLKMITGDNNNRVGMAQ